MIDSEYTLSEFDKAYTHKRERGPMTTSSGKARERYQRSHMINKKYPNQMALSRAGWSFTDGKRFYRMAEIHNRSFAINEMMHDTAPNRVLMWVYDRTKSDIRAGDTMNLSYMVAKKARIEKTRTISARLGKTRRTKIRVRAKVISYESSGALGHIVVDFPSNINDNMKEHVHRVWLLQHNQSSFSGFDVKRKKIRDLSRLTVYPRSYGSPLYRKSGRTRSAPDGIMQSIVGRDGHKRSYVLDERTKYDGKRETTHAGITVEPSDVVDMLEITLSKDNDIVMSTR